MNTKTTSFTWFVTVFPDTHPWTFPEKLPKGVKYMKGQLEECPTTQRKHYHVLIYLEKNSGYRKVQNLVFNNLPVNCQIPRVNEAADKYVTKDQTRLAGPWSLGVCPKKSKNFHRFFDENTPTEHGECSVDIQKYLLSKPVRTEEFKELGSNWDLVEEEITHAIMDRLILE